MMNIDILIDATAFDELLGNAYAGISSKDTALSFTKYSQLDTGTSFT